MWSRKTWKTRILALATGFAIGLTLVLIYTFIAGLFVRKHPAIPGEGPANGSKCLSGDSFAQPEEVLSALKSDDVSTRRDLYRRLFLRPGIATTYYDYERDKDYPERADRVRLQYVNLDDAPDAEALVTFVRFANPVALVLKKNSCGWEPIIALSAWLRFEDYPYDDWIELPETIRPGVHEILIHDSTSDATRYVRQARLLKLIDGSLEQIAEIEEETITPLDQYRGPDWGDVRQRRINRYVFLRGRAARLQIESSSEVIKYSGNAPTYTYWLETDGAWHVSRKHWRARPAERIKFLGSHTEQFAWDEQRKRFVKDGE